MMKITAIAVICVVAMTTTEGFIIPPFGAFPLGMMRPFPGMLHPAMAMPYSPFMGMGGVVPYGPGMAPFMRATAGAAASGGFVDGAAGAPADQGAALDAPVANGLGVMY